MSHPKTLREILQKTSTAELLWRLDGAEPDVQAKICLELGRRSEREAIAQLRKRLDSEDATVRAAAVEALGRIGDQSAGRDLLTIFSDNQQPEEVRDTCAFALGRLAYAPAVPVLVSALADISATVRLCVVSALLAIKDPGVIGPVKIALATEQNERVKTAMRILLESIQPQHEEAVTASFFQELVSFVRGSPQKPRSVVVHIPRASVRYAFYAPTFGVGASSPNQWPVYVGTTDFLQPLALSAAKLAAQQPPPVDRLNRVYHSLGSNWAWLIPLKSERETEQHID